MSFSPAVRAHWPSRAAGDTFSLLDRAEPLVRGRRWALGAVAAGVFPLLAAWATGLDIHRIGSALLLLPFWLSLVKQDRDREAFATVLLAFACHSLLAIGLVALSPQGADAVLRDGPAYWAKNHAWLRTGQDPEYAVANWLPAQAQEAFGMTFFAFTSLGLIPLVHGLYQIDLMNCYVGHLLGVSRASWIALLAGWHVWALLRGMAYARLTYEAASRGLEVLSGASLSTPARRRRRILAGVSLLALDAALKWTLLEPVRAVLAANLRT